ncbi:MAG: transporter [Sphingomonadales bacterium]|nr:transporter [Sphingomonadales bacterium]
MAITTILAAATGLLASQAPSPAIERAPIGVADPARPDKSHYTLFDPTPRELMRAFNTDRPDTTESPYTVDAGHFQVELSLADYAFDKDAGVRTRTVGILPVNLKLGLLNNVDLQLIFTPYQRVETRAGGAHAVASGFSDDTQVRLKINLWGNDGGSTAFAIMPFIKAPTGARGLSNDHVEGGVILPLAIDVPSDFSLGTMAEFDLVYDDARGRYGVDVVHSATLGHPIAGHLAGYLEYVGVVPHGGGGGYRAIASAGLSYPLAENWIVDGGGTLGLAGTVDDATMFIGTSLRF